MPLQPTIGDRSTRYPELRPASSTDNSFLRRVYRSTRDDLTVDGGLDPSQADQLVELQFRAQQADYSRAFPSANHQIVLVDGTPAGRLIVDRSSGVHRLIDISLLPTFRGCGIGTALIQQVTGRAAQVNAVVRLHVRVGSPAEALYRRLGFLPVSEDQNERHALYTELEWRSEHWLPIHVQFGERPQVEWFDATSRRRTDPFFVDAFHRARGRKDAGHRGSLSDLMTEAEQRPGLAPTGLIFHMSRCGSTLLSQMLAADHENLVLSEPPAVDAALRTWFTADADDDSRLAWLRAIVSVLGRPRHGERRYFIKFDSWHTTLLPVLRRAFPGTPWVFVHREPLEVLVSHERNSAAFVLPGAVPIAAFGIDLQRAVTMAPENYTAAVLESICTAAVESLGDSNGMSLDYKDLPGALTAVLAHMGVEVTGDTQAVMEATAAWDAKAPTRRFVPDGAGKRENATTRLRDAARGMEAIMAALRTHSLAPEFAARGAPEGVLA